MPIEVSQLRPEGTEAAVEFAKSIGFDTKRSDIDPNISLIAKEEQQIVAAILGIQKKGGSCTLHVCLGKLDEPEKITHDLIDKSLMKVHGVGIRRCQISHHGRDEQPAEWPVAKWRIEDEAVPEPPVTKSNAEQPEEVIEKPKTDSEAA